MRTRATLTALLVLLASIAFVATGAQDRLAGELGFSSQADGTSHHVIELDVIAFACEHTDDGVCLGYDGQVPGPTLVMNEGDTAEVTITNRVDETLPLLDVPDEVKANLSDVGVSLHTHGVSVPADEDGIEALPGTELEDSFVTPGESLTHHWTADWRGAWHYHDHVLGVEGHDGQERGLYGTLVVLEPGETTDNVLDLHLLDNGANNGRGMNATVEAGERFDLVVVGLGNWFYDVELEHPDGTVDTLEVGPGVSKVFKVDSAKTGTYTWTATDQFTFEQSTGEVVVP